MTISSNILIVLILLILFLVGIVWLQVFLSNRENKWLGLILPAISLMIAILAVLSMATYTNVRVETTTVIEGGEIVKQAIDSMPKEQITSTSSIIFAAIYVFIIYNIPTVILLAIYGGCREKRKKKLELDKMSILDLE